MKFSHLHCHTQYSLLDGAANISALMKKAQQDNMPAVALTDHGNMFGAFKFVAEANRHGVKPIVGCEFYMVADRHKKQFTKEDKDIRNHQLLLAKDQDGYKNLSKLCSLGYSEGLYSKWPRIDKELLLKYHKGLIATTCCIGAEVPQSILREGEDAAEKKFKWWLDIFGEDYYVELQRHNLKDQITVNEVLLRFAKKYNVKVIASNDSHYLDREDYSAHDILLCINTGESQSTPVGDGKGFRFGFPNDEFYFKTTEEMTKLFADVPYAIDNTNEIVDKITPPILSRDILLPNFTLPPQFNTQDDYLRAITFSGARKRYKEISSDIEDRINFELGVIKTMGFAGYFLIVQDFISAGRKLGVGVGPGRGSAAGSVVAYCIGITNIDPIKYNLLFERFLNPERVSMPDIDIDFDDEGRQKVIDYVVDKYGKNQVAQIVTFGTMAARSSIRDVARAMDLSLFDANEMAKMVPETAGITLEQAYSEVHELNIIRNQNNLKGIVLRNAEKLEGSVRSTGTHAAGIIIAPSDITEFVPVCANKDSELLVTQFDGKVIEDAGMLKMDFLGLRTLTIMRDCLALVKEYNGIDINIDEIPLDDEKTFELYQKGNTVGTFQFESEGMQMYLKDLKPNNIEDLIAMNALYRPGPMQFIPNYIDRKQGREKVNYPHPLLEPILKNTYGIMVYQEQIMQTAQILAGYSLGGADLLRRAMGKKDKEKMEKQKAIFIQGAFEKNNIPEKKAAEIFTIMERFAEYGFNRSHSAAYSLIAYQTAYLKAHYTAEYMSAVLTNHIGKIEDLTYFLNECSKQDIKVLGPDLNESSVGFAVANGNIRFGLAAIKGTGEVAIESIIRERKKGSFKSVFEFAERINPQVVNKRTFQCLALSGAFDCFPDFHRAQYFAEDLKGKIYIEKIIKYGNDYRKAALEDKNGLFGTVELSLPKPIVPECETWTDLIKLKHEKDNVGFYVSGHPLDQYRRDIKDFCTCSLSEISEHKKKDISVAGIVSKVQVKHSKGGNAFAIISLEDFTDTFEIALFGATYKKYSTISAGEFVFITGKVTERYNQPDAWEIKVNSISNLESVRKNLTKKISIEVNNLSDMTLLRDLFLSNEGNCEAYVSLSSLKENIAIEMSFNRKVTPTITSLIDELGFTYLTQ